MPKIPQSSSKPRKPREMTWDNIDKMLEAGCEGTEIAAFFGISDDTLYRACQADKGCGFAAYRAQKRSSGDTLLKETMFASAMKGDRALQIFLAKNRLGMRDNPKDDTSDTQPIVKIEITHIDPENAEPSDG